MAQTYVGYGFNIEDIPNSALVELMHTHDAEEYAAFVEELKEDCPGDDIQKLVEEEIDDHICEISDGITEYIRDIINAGEQKEAGTDYIVSSYDNYVVFDSCRFAEDSPRTTYIRTVEDFIAMIARYLPVEEITFGNIYDGVEWVGPCYYMD